MVVFLSLAWLYLGIGDMMAWDLLAFIGFGVSSMDEI